MSGSGSSGLILVAVVAAETGTLGWTKDGAIAAAIAGRRIVSRIGEIILGAGRGSSTGWLSGSRGVTTGGGDSDCVRVWPLLNRRRVDRD
ncbi:hypothetical protein PI126_g17367 [Phytophthora idaei]|nr:hypothetical protein PI126_g17367 [Phytophthora idaei]